MPPHQRFGSTSPTAGTRGPDHRNDFLSAFDTLFSCQGALIRSSCGTGYSGSADSSPLTKEGSEPAA